MTDQEAARRPVENANRTKVRGLPVLGWVLYDLANTIFSFNILSLYFPVWLVQVMGARDADYAFASSLSMGVIFLLSPFLGALTDQAPRRMPFLVFSTFWCVGLTFFLGHSHLGVTLLLFGVANIAYQAGLQFYDALLTEVSTEANRGRIGGVGVGVGYLGSLLGIGLGHTLLQGVEEAPKDVQTASYVEMFRITAVLFLLFSLPCFLAVRERARKEVVFGWGALAASSRQVWHTIRSTRQHPQLVRFLVGRFFYTDAINTVVAFMGIYVTAELDFTASEASEVLFLGILFAVAGGLAWGPVVDRIGPKCTLNLVLGLWTIAFAWAAGVGLWNLPGSWFWPVPCLVGISLGGTWTADRPYMLRLTPPDRVGEFYGLYGMVGRFAAITGPAVWGLVADVLGWGRPAAILTLMAGVLLGYWILRPVSDEPRDWTKSSLQPGRDFSV